MKFVKENCIHCGVCTTTDYVKVWDDWDKIIRENLTTEEWQELKDMCPTGAFED